MKFPGSPRPCVDVSKNSPKPPVAVIGHGMISKTLIPEVISKIFIDLPGSL